MPAIKPITARSAKRPPSTKARKRRGRLRRPTKGDSETRLSRSELQKLLVGASK